MRPSLLLPLLLLACVGCGGARVPWDLSRINTRAATTLPMAYYVPSARVDAACSDSDARRLLLSECARARVRRLFLELPVADHPPEGLTTLLKQARVQHVKVVLVPFLFAVPEGRGDAFTAILSRHASASPSGDVELIPDEGPLPRTLALSPASPAARDRARRLFDELLALDVDAVCIGDCRYASPQSDLSDTGRNEFEAWRGGRVKNWPGDLLVGLRDAPRPEPAPTGELWRQWALWRALTLRRFLFNLREVVDEHPGKQLWLLVDGYYQTHYRDGLNWASPNLALGSALPGLPRYYESTGVAHLADAIVLNLTVPVSTRERAVSADCPPWASVEGAGAVASTLVAREAPTWALILPSTYGRDVEQFREALDALAAHQSGYVIPAP